MIDHHGPGPLARVSEALWQTRVIEHSRVPLAADHALAEVLGGHNVAPVTQTLRPGELRLVIEHVVIHGITTGLEAQRTTFKLWLRFRLSKTKSVNINGIFTAFLENIIA